MGRVGGSIALASLLLGFSPQEKPAETLAARYVSQVRPLLEARCFKCHGPQKKKGGIDYASMGAGVLRERKTWKKALDQVEGLAMPPEEEKPLSPAERSTLLAWFKEAAAFVDLSAPRDPGPPLTRRLTRDEYSLTVRDLLGIDVDVAEKTGIPEESTGHVFDNVAGALVLPPALLEKYFAAADAAIEAAATAPKGRKGRTPISLQPAAGLEPRAAAKSFLEAFARRAYRRPARADEV